TSRLSSRPSESTSSPPASSTHRCRHRSSAMNSKIAATSFSPRFPSGASSDRPTVAAHAVHIMTNTALTGATYDIARGQQLVDGGKNEPSNEADENGVVVTTSEVIDAICSLSNLSDQS